MPFKDLAMLFLATNPGTASMTHPNAVIRAPGSHHGRTLPSRSPSFNRAGLFKSLKNLGAEGVLQHPVIERVSRIRGGAAPKDDVEEEPESKPKVFLNQLTVEEAREQDSGVVTMHPSKMAE